MHQFEAKFETRVSFKRKLSPRKCYNWYIFYRKLVSPYPKLSNNELLKIQSSMEYCREDESLEFGRFGILWL